MKRVFILFALALTTLAAAAQGRIVTDTLYSKNLQAQQYCNVYLPEGYSVDRHYPVVYLLHGLSDDYQSWQKLGRMKDVADELIASGELLPVIIVMPNAGDQDIHNYQNGYFNMPGWPFEDWFFHEFLPAMEGKYNCGGSKGQRAIMGLSMGGGGSVVYCQRHPGLFSSCYAMSPWLDNKNHEVDTEHGPGSKLVNTQKSVCEHSALDFLARADEATVEQLKTVKWFIDCGDDDYLLHQTLQLYPLMRQRGIKAELRVRNGIHNWEYWHAAVRTALPFASRNFYE
ncbi:MAG: esterase family protein [Bacteroidales bacterium]|nr:esterase family protein [Bacteroidales bacterium]